MPVGTGAVALLLVSCLVTGVWSATASAQNTDSSESDKLTIEQVIFLALKNSRAAIEARLNRDEQELALEAAEERYLPSVSAGADIAGGKDRDRMTSVDVGPRLRVPTGGTFQLRWSKPVEGTGDRAATTSLTFTQPLLKGFGPDIDMAPLRKSRIRERINVGAFRDRVAGVVESVITAFRRVLQTRRQVTVAREALERARRQLEVNRTLVDAGRMAPQDLVQAEASVADREFALNDSEDALDSANLSLLNVLDLEEGRRIEPLEEPAVRPERPDLEQSLETAFQRRTDWLTARLGVEIAQMDLRVAKSNRLPNLSLTLGTSRRGGGQSETDYRWELRLTAPLWDHDSRRALARAGNQVRRSQMALAEARQSIRIEVRQAVRGVAVALRQIDVAGKARALAQRKLEIERLKLRQGLSTAFQLGRFEDDLVTAQRREIDAVAGYRNALISLDRTLGTTLERWEISVERVGR